MEKKNLIKQSIYGLGILVASLVILPAALSARGTLEIYGDGGLFLSTREEIGVDAFEVIWNWQGSIQTLNPDSTDDPEPPEGRKTFSSFVNQLYGGWGIYKVLNSNHQTPVAHDYSAFKDGHLRFWLKSPRAVKLELEYLNDQNSARNQVITIPSTFSGTVLNATLIRPNDGDLTLVVANSPNSWKEVVIPLNQLRSDFNFKKVVSPFKITMEFASNTTFQVDHIRWTKPVVPPLRVFPNTVSVGPGEKRQVSIEGRSAEGDPIYLHGNYAISPSLGAMSPAGEFLSMGSVLTAGSSGTGQMIAGVVQNVGATAGAMQFVNGSANVNIVSDGSNPRFGLLSETIDGIKLGSDNPGHNGDLLLYSENTLNESTLPVVSNDANAPPEGVVSLKTVLRQKPSATQFQGWAIQWGRAGVPAEQADSYVIDMQQYYEGSLRFWFKAPNNPNLVEKLEVGIRSGNIEAGKEISKIKLKDVPGVRFDNQWHAVSIPMTEFARPRPWADLSRMKVLFNVSIAGVVGGSEADRTFYIDNLRWDSELPSEVVSLTVSPASVLVPLNGRREFVATGLDANGRAIDITPTWDMPDGSLGTLSGAIGNRVLLTAAGTTTNGRIRVQAEGLTAFSNVQVAPIEYTQSFNVYSDMGSGGDVGVSTGPADPTQTQMVLSEQTGDAPEGLTFRRAGFTLDNFGETDNAFAVWFTEEPFESRYMRFYADGYLHFWVRTAHDLQISIRSINITPGAELSKIRLSELGVPFDNTWQQVIVALADFRARDPRLDFDRMKNFFTIGALSSQAGEVTDAAFDVDDVKWLATDVGAPDVNKVYQGLKAKQRPTGLVRSYDTETHAYTYDQALAAMAYTYHKDFSAARQIFSTYQTRFFNAANFDGFHEAYHIDTFGIWNANRLAGPNAWMLLAIVHHRNATGNRDFDTMATALAEWLVSLQDPSDGAIRFGRPVDVTLTNVKSTEHNMDAYAAFLAYRQAFSGSFRYQLRAQEVLNWLQTRAWNTAERRFNVGTRSNGLTLNTDKALDVYSWAPLALSSYTSVLALAERDFRTTRTSVLTGASVTGFDFSGPVGAPVDRDAVWLEGTAQMALAYNLTGDHERGDFYLNEIRKAIVNVSPTTQGLPYATNDGTAYGFNMTSLNPAVSSMAWYIFAERNFNPFRVAPIFSVQAKNVRTHQQAAADRRVLWGSAAPQTGWNMATTYIQLDAQPITRDNWFIQIYTDNMNNQQFPRFVDPTPDNKTNPDSNPSGLLYYHRADPVPTPSPNASPVPNPTPSGVTSWTLPVSWTIKPSTVAVGVDLLSADPDTGPVDGPGNRYQWFFIKDKNTPNIDLTGNGDSDIVAYQEGEPYIRVWGTAGLHGVQGPPGADYFPHRLHTAYMYLQANFQQAAARALYRTRLYFEYFIE